MFLPVPKAHDGSQVGNSYLSLWLNCRRKWFAKYLWPHEDGSTGLEVPYRSLRLGPRGLLGPGSNLMMGSLLHKWKEAWYLSAIKDGADTGQYDLDAANEALGLYATERSNEFEDTAAQEWAVAQVLNWGASFHRFYGPGGHTPLWPELQVLCMEDGRPAIELDVTVPLHHKDFIYTARLDCVKLWQGRYLVVDETKTAAPSWVERYIAQLPRGSQFTGQLFCLRYAEELKALPWDKLQVTYHLKGWSNKSQFPTPAMTGSTTRSPDQLERFRLRVIRTLQEIDEAVNAPGWGWDGPGRDLLFPETGEHTGYCYSFNSECEFMGPCRMGFSAGSLGGFRPARKPGEALTSAIDTDDVGVA